MKRFFLLALVVAGVVACSPAPEISLTKNDHGKAINAAPSQSITITLDSNVTTGYKWNLVGEPNSQIARLVSSQYNAPQNTGGMVGVGGTETWKFQAINAGTTTITLAYFRPFDPSQIGGEFTVTVNVR